MAKHISERRFAKQAIEGVLVGAIEYGSIDPDGKTDDELNDLFTDYIADFVQSPGPIYTQSDQLPDLLKRARKELKAERFDYAALFYATWIEHWVNWHVRCLAVRKRALTDAQITAMLRDVNYRGKLTWLMALLGRKQIARKHLNAIQRICDHRNAFIHHKYPSFNVDEDLSLNSSLATTVTGFEATVRYLQNLDAMVIKKGVRAKIKRFALGRNRGRTKR